jgi:hypothetical protein
VFCIWEERNPTRAADLPNTWRVVIGVSGVVDIATERPIKTLVVHDPASVAFSSISVNSLVVDGIVTINNHGLSVTSVTNNTDKIWVKWLVWLIS